mmetsp:Transcript_13646/g.42197  ORF Transcript_13646/g.42197 Transcript_13646/m.42197 type:complete len:272 (+) Transcript_13646:59-874(+)
MQRVAAAGAASASAVAAAAYAYHAAEQAPPTALKPGSLLRCKLERVDEFTPDTARYRFALPSARHVLGVRPAGHVLAVDGGNVARAYTPLDAARAGAFDIVVRRYAGGYFSEKFAALRPGDALDFRGPEPTLEYAPNVLDSVVMVAGGTGVAPMLQLLTAALADDADATKFRLLYATRTPADAVLLPELDALRRRHPARLEISYHAGPVSKNALADFLPAPRRAREAVLVSGPPGLVELLCGPKPPGQESEAPVAGLLGSMGFSRQTFRLD